MDYSVPTNGLERVTRGLEDHPEGMKENTRTW